MQDMNSTQSCMQEPYKSLTRLLQESCKICKGILLRTYIHCCYGNQFLHPHAIIKFSYTVITIFRQCHKLHNYCKSTKVLHSVMAVTLLCSCTSTLCSIINLASSEILSVSKILIFILSDYLNNKNSLQVLQ